MAYTNTRARPDNNFIVWSEELTISTDRVLPMYNADIEPAWGSDQESRVLIIDKIHIMYSEDTDAVSVNNIIIGSANVPAKYLSASSNAGKLAGDIDIFTQDNMALSRVFTTDNWIQVEMIGGIGAGKIKIGLELSFDYTKWINYSPTLS